MGAVVLFRVVRACVLLLVAAIGHCYARLARFVAVLFTSWPNKRARVLLWAGGFESEILMIRVPIRELWRGYWLLSGMLGVWCVPGMVLVPATRF